MIPTPEHRVIKHAVECSLGSFMSRRPEATEAEIQALRDTLQQSAEVNMQRLFDRQYEIVAEHLR